MILDLIQYFFRSTFHSPLIVFLFIINTIHGQTVVYPTTIVAQSNVENSTQSIDANMSSFAGIKANPGALLGLGAYDGHLELQFPSIIPANTTTFIKVDADDAILTSMLGGNLGGVLANTAGVALIGNQEFSVHVKNGTSTALFGSSTNPADFGTEFLNIVVNKYNETFIAITPNVPYDRVRITNHAGASLIGLNTDKVFRVYDAYYVTNPALCGDPGFTSFNAGGVNIDLLEIAGSGATNIHKAIDIDYVSHSELSLGVLNLPAWIEQKVYFEGLSTPSEVFGIKFRLDQSLAVLGVLNNITFRTQNGANMVNTYTLGSVITQQGLDSLSNGQAVTVYIQPGAPIDRVIFRYTAILGINLNQFIELVEVFKIPVAPVMNVLTSNTTVCMGSSTNLVGDADDPNWLINWYSDSISTTPIGTTNSGSTFITGPITSDTVFYITAVKPGCTNETEQVPVNITVIPVPTASDLTLAVNPAGYCENTPIVISPSSSVGNQFNWFLDANGTQAITNGMTVGNITYSIDAQGNLTISGLSNLGSPYTFYSSVTDSTTGCSNMPGDLANAVVTIISEPAPTTSNSNPSFCVVDLATIADLPINETGVNWYDENGMSIPTSTILTDSTEYFATITGAMCESDSLIFLVEINDELAPTTNDTTQYFCPLDNATLNDLQTIGTSITWYDSASGGTVLPNGTALVNGETYFATQTGLECESSQTLAVNVVIDDLPTPTAAESTQYFCIANNPTIDDITTNESSIIWYSAASGGSPIPNGTPIVNGGIYYAALVSPNCESAGRLEITAIIENVAAPTTSNTIQTFCSIDSPQIADLAVNESNIVWYDAPTNGNSYSSTDPLVDQTSYYAAQVGQYCESTVRTLVFVVIEDVPAPTTSATNQVFCTSITPTIADLDVNESNINWYDENGNLLSTTTVLVDGATYFASQVGPNCESATQLEITVSVEDVYGAEIAGQTQNICSTDTVEYETLPGMSNYNWNVQGGTIVAGGTSTSNTISIVWSSGSNPSLSVSYNEPGGCQISMLEEIAIETISCSDLTITKTVDNEAPFVGDNVIFTIKVKNEGVDNFIDVLVSEQLPSGFEYISHSTNNGTYNPTTGDWTIALLTTNATATLTLKAKVLGTGDHLNIARIVTSSPFDSDLSNNQAEALSEPNCLTVYNEISPNGDGENDYLIIDCIESYPNNSISIFNRFGNIIYTTDSYKNDWDGVANVGGTIGKGETLPTGTYFYILKVEEEDFETNGWIYIVR